jgi:phosphomannomutase
MKGKNEDAGFSAFEDRYKHAGKDYVDGLTVEYSAWWFNLRASNTDPSMRLNLEANDTST